MTDRGVSEAIGFVLVASLIISTIAVVYVAGVGGLEDARDAERIRNAERAFDVLDDNFDDIRGRGAPSRATEIRLADAQLEFGESTELTVDVNTTGGSVVTNASKDTAPIVYAAGGDRAVVYEAGAVIRTDPDGAVMRNAPPMTFTDSGGLETAVIPLVETRREGSVSVGGETTVLVRAENTLRQVLIAETNASGLNVSVTIETTETRAQAWADYLNQSAVIPDDYHRSGTTCSLDGGTVLCELEVQRVTYTRIGIDVRFA